MLGPLLTLGGIAVLVLGVLVGWWWRGEENTAVSAQLAALVEKRARDLAAEREPAAPALPVAATRMDRTE
jgi:uncharacterized membrane protein YqiK